MFINIDPIAAYAAFISTCTLAWLIWRERPKVKIDILDLSQPNDQHNVLLVSLINKTHHPIKLESYGVDFIEDDKHKRNLVVLVSDTDKERNIPERDNLTLSFDLTLLKSREIKLNSFFVTDSTYRTYRKSIPNRIVREFIK